MRLAIDPHPIRFWIAIAVTVLLCCLAEAQAPAVGSLAIARNYYLGDLIRMPSYSPGKNSFLVQKLHRGDRRTLLKLSGGGSVRHIWSTWSIPGDNSDIPAPGRVFVWIFVDGESKPAISGALDELCRAAEATGTRFVPLPAFNYKGAFNFYLPIFFTRSILIEMEAVDEIEEFYTQIDYRIESRPHVVPILTSKKEKNGLTLVYTDEAAFHLAESMHREPARQSNSLNLGENAGEFVIDGPGVLRTLTFRGSSLADLELRIYWDDESIASVQAPLRYLFADFTNVALKSNAGESTCYFLMPFRRKARIVVRSLTGASGHVTVDYALEHAPLAPRTLYFHARYQETEKTRGYLPHSVLQIQGEGLFVGMNLFDSGHNHGGGDSALIDGGTAEPRVLHGICGEDYFGFAWHQTGTMTLLTGAPVHERRYRLHLENPYPFHQSFQFSFGVFAGQHPKSVAFWYQLHEAASGGPWVAVDASWKIFGPVALEAALPDAVTDDGYSTVALIKEPTKLSERWQDAEMRSGFFDATYQFRHYAMIESGTGFVAGAGKTRMRTYMYSPSVRRVDAIVGHDDRVLVRLNRATLADIQGRSGFGPARIRLKLRAGWNALDLVVYNDENVNWRWCGISLALERSASSDLRFASELPGTTAKHGHVSEIEHELGVPAY